jgi:hypothetical protein
MTYIIGTRETLETDEQYQEVRGSYCLRNRESECACKMRLFLSMTYI